MSVLFNHACRYEFFDRNPIRLVRQSAKRKAAPHVLTPHEIRSLVDALDTRERASWSVASIASAMMGVKGTETERLTGSTDLLPQMSGLPTTRLLRSMSALPVRVSLRNIRTELLAAQSDHWVDGRGAAGGNETGQCSDNN
jgi:hypothetical protein